MKRPTSLSSAKTAKRIGIDKKSGVKMSRRAWFRDQQVAEHDAQQPVAAG